MPRPTMTPALRIAKVNGAARNLRATLREAVALQDSAASDADKRAAWILVEESAATIHRQTRLLAGKSKGG